MKKNTTVSWQDTVDVKSDLISENDKSFAKVYPENTNKPLKVLSKTWVLLFQKQSKKSLKLVDKFIPLRFIRVITRTKQ